MEIIPIGKRSIMARSIVQQRHPKACVAILRMDQQRLVVTQRHAVQWFQPFQPVKQRRLTVAIQRATGRGLRSQEIIVIFTFKRQNGPRLTQ